MEFNFKKLIYAIIAVIMCLFVWQIAKKANERTERAIREIEEGTTLNSSDLKGAMQKMEENIRVAQSAIQKGDYESAALKMYHFYPGFESILNAHGFKEVETGLTLRAWFDTKKETFISYIRDQYPAMLDKLKIGDLSSREFNHFLNHMPFPFINDIQRKYNTDKTDIIGARTENAPGWFMVSVICNTGSGANYERIVCEALRKKWSDLPGLKLVLDIPMNTEERQAAVKVIDVQIEEQYGEYVFEGKQAYRGGERVPEKVTVTFRNDTRRQDSPVTTWDALSPITTTYQAPEKLKFKFKNERQMADFSDIVASQRKALETSLVSAVESIPRLELR